MSDLSASVFFFLESVAASRMRQDASAHAVISLLSMFIAVLPVITC